MFDSDFEYRVTKLLFGYIWKSTEWVSRTTLARPRHEGGLVAVYEIQSRLAALRGAHICRLISGPPARWHTFAAYWIGLQLRDWRADLASNSRPHSEFEMPEYYSRALNTFKMVYSNTPARPVTTLTALRENDIFAFNISPHFNNYCSATYATHTFRKYMASYVGYKSPLSAGPRDVCWRICHSVIPIRGFLSRFQRMRSDRCPLCAMDVEYVSHLFHSCIMVK